MSAGACADSGTTGTAVCANFRASSATAGAGSVFEYMIVTFNANFLVNLCRSYIASKA